MNTADRLAEFHRVENTYLSTFQTLGGLGLLLGTVGLAAVLLRNVLERRRELALLGAVGYGRNRLFVIVVAESTLLLVWGLAAGTLCAIVATLPAAANHRGRLPIGASGWLMLFAVFATGLVRQSNFDAAGCGFPKPYIHQTSRMTWRGRVYSREERWLDVDITRWFDGLQEWLKREGRHQGAAQAGWRPQGFPGALTPRPSGRTIRAVVFDPLQRRRDHEEPSVGGRVRARPFGRARIRRRVGHKG